MYIKVLICFLISILMIGCTSYAIEKEIFADGSSTTHVTVRSTRDIDQPNLHYERKGNDATFDFSAAGVDNNTDAFLGMFQGMMGTMMSMFEKMMQMQSLQLPPTPDSQ